MHRKSQIANGYVWALVAALLVGGFYVSLVLRGVSRNSVQHDPMLLLAHPAGSVPDGLARASGTVLARAALALLPALFLLVLAWTRRAVLAWRAPIVAGIVGSALLVVGAGLYEARSAVRTLCWAAHSPAYGRSVRDRALALGQAKLRAPLGRVAEILGAKAGPICATAALELGRADAQKSDTGD